MGKQIRAVQYTLGIKIHNTSSDTSNEIARTCDQVRIGYVEVQLSVVCNVRLVQHTTFCILEKKRSTIHLSDYRISTPRSTLLERKHEVVTGNKINHFSF